MAGIIDSYGGIRFVVTPRSHLKYHTRHDELCIIVPGLLVHEPIAWGDIPYVIARISLVVENWIDTHGIPNDPIAREAVQMYRIRQLRNPNRTIDLNEIAYT